MTKQRVDVLARGEGTRMGKRLLLGSTFTGLQCTAACGRSKWV